jgi:hypothetical protein
VHLDDDHLEVGEVRVVGERLLHGFTHLVAQFGAVGCAAASRQQQRRGGDDRDQCGSHVVEV